MLAFGSQLNRGQCRAAWAASACGELFGATDCSFTSQRTCQLPTELILQPSLFINDGEIGVLDKRQPRYEASCTLHKAHINSNNHFWGGSCWEVVSRDTYLDIRRQAKGCSLIKTEHEAASLLLILATSFSVSSIFHYFACSSLFHLPSSPLSFIPIAPFSFSLPANYMLLLGGGLLSS